MVTLTIPTATSCDLVMVSNAAPTEFFACQESGDSMPHSYARANAQTTAVHLIAGRQYPIAFREAVEGNSDVFQRTLLVAIDTPAYPMTSLDPGGVDRWPFDPLIALIEDPALPYVALCDGHGRRWATFPEYVVGSYGYQGHEHSADVKFTEVADVALTTDAPWT